MWWHVPFTSPQYYGSCRSMSMFTLALMTCSLLYPCIHTTCGQRWENLWSGAKLQEVTLKAYTHMDVELHVLPLAKTSKFVTEGKKTDNKMWVCCMLWNSSIQWPNVHPHPHPPPPRSHLSMNFWKIFPLKLSQISTMYGCRGQTH